MADITNRADWIVFSNRDATDLTAKDPIQGENSGRAGSTGQRGRAKKLAQLGSDDETHNANDIAAQAKRATQAKQTTPTEQAA